MEHTFEKEIQTVLHYDAHKTIETATATELYNAISKAAMARLQERWEQPTEGKRAAYFSAEFLVGRVVEANLLNLGLLTETRELLAAHGVSTTIFEVIEDAALGNGGLGRLAACFMESLASLDLPDFSVSRPTIGLLSVIRGRCGVRRSVFRSALPMKRYGRCRTTAR